MGVAAYGSLVPLQFVDLSIENALAAARTLVVSARPPARPVDWVANVLLAIPIGFCLLGALILGTRGRTAELVGAAVISGLCIAFAAGLEFAQLWLPARMTSVTDVMAQGLGGAVGSVLWLIAGSSLTRWIHRYTRSESPPSKGVRLLEAYLFGFFVYAILPLNLTINPASLYRKFRNGRIVIIPFSDLGLDAQSAYSVVRDILVFVPIGILVAQWRLPPGRLRPVGACLALAARGASGRR